MGLFTKMFGTYSERQIKKLNRTVNQIEALADKYKQMSDDELRGVTEVFRARLKAGETLDSILPDAFAAVREADDRVLGKRPFRVQLIGGIILHQGRIAEMKTGEGKTLVATLPAYLNALKGEGVHIVTVNDYLARCGHDEMGRVYGYLGMTTGLIIPGQSAAQKHDAYNADITYGTNNEFGFDYLRDNTVVYKENMVQRGHNFAIVDEVDSILIDEARTPLIISGMGDTPTDLYERADNLVNCMKKFVVKEVDKKVDLDEDEKYQEADYIVTEKDNTAVLTAKGVEKAAKFFNLEYNSDSAEFSVDSFDGNQVDNARYTEIMHHVNQAIKAHGCMKRDVDYVVNKNGVIIVDSFTGRLMPGRRFSDGLHQAIEAKEGVKVEKENKTLATITFQNYFRMYKKLSGMTGTALTEDEEFREIYALDVVEVPTNKPMIRIDHPDRIYQSTEAKYNAIIEQIKECHEKGQPVLAGTVSIDKSEELSRRLRQAGIAHVVLNAKFHQKEAMIVAQAGKFGAVTIATNMAGRGTDILLGGNPEYMAKEEMRRMGYAEEVVIEANGTSRTDNPEIIEGREKFRELFDRYTKEIQPEAEKVKNVGGLFILGTERHESRRIDNQLRGRAGRQGDPGESRFYLSTDDDLMRLFAPERWSGLMSTALGDPNAPLDVRLMSSVIERAQKGIEGQNFRRRKYVLEYDDVMNQQRAVIYGQRNDVLNGEDVSVSVKKMIKQVIETAVGAYTNGEHASTWNIDGLRAHFMGYLCREDDLVYTDDELAHLTQKKIAEKLEELAETRYNSQAEVFGDKFQELQRCLLLEAVDTAWVQQIDAMEDLKDSIGMQSYAQRNPVTEYRVAGANMFDDMVEEIRENTVRMIFSAAIRPKPIVRKQVAKPIVAGLEGDKETRARLTVKCETKKVGRNDPCPCGSGKKYKNCCGRNNANDGE